MWKPTIKSKEGSQKTKASSFKVPLPYCLPSSTKKPPCSENLLNCTLYLVVGFWYLMVKKSQRNPLIRMSRQL